jgi:hypothetical protein
LANSVYGKARAERYAQAKLSEEHLKKSTVIKSFAKYDCSGRFGVESLQVVCKFPFNTQLHPQKSKKWLRAAPNHALISLGHLTKHRALARLGDHPHPPDAPGRPALEAY